jgi:hypothetical protein
VSWLGRLQAYEDQRGIATAPMIGSKNGVIPGSAMWNPDFTFLERATG